MEGEFPEIDKVEGKAIQAGPEKYEDRNFVDTSRAVWNYSILYDDDVATFQNGTHYTLYKKFGSKKIQVFGQEGYYFCVWAPNATQVSVIGNFNDWNPDSQIGRAHV